MSTFPVPPRSHVPSGAQPNVGAEPGPVLHFKSKDFEKTIDFLPSEKQDYARRLFPKDTTGRWRSTDEGKLNEFMSTLDPLERDDLAKILQGNKMSLMPTKLKDTGRFTPVPSPEARRAAQGADLKSPLGSHATSPLGMDEDFPKPTGTAKGKPNPESSKPNRATLADLFAEERPSRDSHFSPHNQTPPPPRKGNLKKETEAGTTQGNPKPETSKSSRVRFAEQARVREYPRDEGLDPNQSFHESLHDVSFEPKNPPERRRPTEDTAPAQEHGGASAVSENPAGHETSTPHAGEGDGAGLAAAESEEWSTKKKVLVGLVAGAALLEATSIMEGTIGVSVAGTTGGNGG